ncbi:MAG: hypothetical protein EOM87_07035, partial [Clostridia bacterium]|nr:hypothetical protein [Clostridia bacterium]
MKKIAVLIIRKRKLFFLLFAVALIAAAVCIPFTNINYDDTFYLPDSSGTKAGLDVMKDEFGSGGSAYAMLKGKSIEEILSVKSEIIKTAGVSNVLWLDDILLPLTESSESNLKDTKKVEYILRALNVLPKSESATAYDALTALQSEFDDNEFIAVMSIINGITGGSLNISDPSTMTEPLGNEYAIMINTFTAQIESFFKNGNALFTISFTESDYSSSTYKALKSIASVSDDLYLSGNSASAYYMQQNQLSEIISATLMAAGIALAVLFLLSSSWFDPIVYIIAILAAIVLNMGSNIIFENVSYMTSSVACVLQLALSMDYAVFLLNRYKKERQSGKNAKDAMAEALTRSFSPISASSLTTIVCFVTIMFMKYKLGLDMGLVMAKAIIMSLVTVFLLLPGIIVAFDKRILSSEHKTFSFSAKRLSRFIYKFRWGIAVLAVLIIIPCAFFANRNAFVYGSKSSQSPESEGIINREIIEKTFGSQETLALIVPKDDEKELMLSYMLLQNKGVSGVTSWALIESGAFGAYFPDSMKNTLIGSNNYNRIM